MRLNHVYGNEIQEGVEVWRVSKVAQDSSLQHQSSLDLLLIHLEEVIYNEFYGPLT